MTKRFLTLQLISRWMLVTALLASSSFATSASANSTTSGDFDHFGDAVAMTADIAAVGVPVRGEVFLFRRDAGRWVQFQRLESELADDRFGAALAISNEFLLIGEPNADRVHVYRPSPSGDWVADQVLTGVPGNRFGHAVAITGGTLAIVGAPDETVQSMAFRGAAHVFVRSGGTWVAHPRLTAPDGSANDRFGLSVDIEGTTAVVGAPFRNNPTNGVGSLGSVYVFNRSCATCNAWPLQATIERPHTEPSSEFGYALAFSGNTLIVGAPDDGGSAYVYTRSGTAWTERARLLPATGAVGDRFAETMALAVTPGVASEFTVLLGSPKDDVGDRLGPGRVDEGSVSVYTGAAASWTLRTTLVQESTGAADEYFGTAVALAGDRALVGTPEDDGFNVEEGAVFEFTRTGTNWAETQRIKGQLPPTLSLPSDYAMDEDQVRQLTVAVGDVDTAFASLTFEKSSDNAALLPVANLDLEGTASPLTLRLRPLENQHGTANVTIAVRDGMHVVQRTLAVEVRPVNDAPSLAALSDVIFDEGGSAAVDLLLTDPDANFDDYAFTLTSNNASLFSNTSLEAGFSGTGATRRLSLTPPIDGNGNAVITVRVDDGARSVQDAFIATVRSVNDAPTFTLANDGNLPVHPRGSTGARFVANFAAGFDPGSNEDAQRLVAYHVDKLSEQPPGVVNSVSIGNDRGLRYTLTGVSGTAHFAVRAQDDGGTANGGIDHSMPRFFSLTVAGEPAPSAVDLAVTVDDAVDTIAPDEEIVYELLVGNFSTSTDAPQATLTFQADAMAIHGITCVPVRAAACPLPRSESPVELSLPAGSLLRYLLSATPRAAPGETVSLVAHVALPPGSPLVDAVPSNDVDADVNVVRDGEVLFVDGFEPRPGPLVRMGAAAIE